MISQVLYVINDDGSLACTEMLEAFCNKTFQLFLVHANAVFPFARFFILYIIANLFRQDFIENHTPQRSLHKTVAFHARRDGRLQIQRMMLISEQSLLDTRDEHSLACSTRSQDSQIVGTENHVLCRDDNRIAVFRRKDMMRSQHQNASLCLRFCRKRQMDRHLVSVEVRVVCRTSQRMQLERTPFCQHRFKGLNTQAMQRRCTIQKNRMLFDDVLQDIPNLRLNTLNCTLCRFDIIC